MVSGEPCIKIIQYGLYVVCLDFQLATSFIGIQSTSGARDGPCLMMACLHIDKVI